MKNSIARSFGPAAILIAMLLGSAAFGQKWAHPFDFPQSKKCPQEVMAVIEIPAGSYIKYELDKATGHVVVDRFQSVPMFYPANYGVITQTLAGDGDNLDVLVYTRTPIQSGAIIAVRPIGILKMIDGGEEDDKVIAVPTDDVDPTYAEVRSIEDLPKIERDRLEFFFKTYKTLPAGRKVVEVRGLLAADTAVKEISKAVTAYARSKGTEGIRCSAPTENSDTPKQ